MIRNFRTRLSIALLAACLGTPRPAWPQIQTGKLVAVSPGGAAQGIALTPSQQDFAVHLEATFSRNPDQGIALTSGVTQNFDQFAVTLRAIGGGIQARGPDGYPTNSLPIAAGVPTELIVTGNVAQRVFSAWVAQAGRPFTQIADHIGFRTGNRPASINTLMVWSDAGAISVRLVDGSCVAGVTYDLAILADHPAAFWDINPRSGTEPDLSSHGHTGTYHGGTFAVTNMPNGDKAGVFNGVSQYLSVPSSPSLSIPTTRSLSFEMWIQPAVLQFPNSSGDGYVDIMGKCAEYSPTCEWEARLYNTANPEGRCNRLSAYVFNPSGGFGSGADWQPVCGLLQAGQWIHVVGEYTTLTQPAACPSASTYPGSIDIWVDGVKWDQAAHNPTGCMSQYSVVPKANNSPLTIGTMAFDTWFKGAIAKVAIYDYRLTQAQISSHYQAMTGRQPKGSCSETCTF